MSAHHIVKRCGTPHPAGGPDMHGHVRTTMVSMVLAGFMAIPPWPTAAATMSPDVEAAVARDGVADVIVNLAVPPPAGPFGSATALADRRQEVRAAQGRVLTN